MSEVRLPSAVRRQAEAADAALRQLQGEIAGEDPGQFVSEGDSETDTGIDTSNYEATEEASFEEIPQESVADEGDSSTVNWQAEAKALREERDKALAKFNSLRGKYEAEVPRLSEELRNLRAELAELKSAPQASDTSFSDSLEVEGKSEADLREMYGDEFVAALLAVQRRAVESAKRELAPSLDRLNQIERRAVQDAEEAMFSTIAKEHPDWEKVNDLASWQKFLAEVNPDTGEPRQMAINRAQQRNDPQPIIRQLSAFKRRAKRGNQALETQVVPGSTGRTEAAPAPDQAVYSAVEIDNFFKRVAMAKSRGVPLSDDQKRQETNYTKAMMEGRVQ